MVQEFTARGLRRQDIATRVLTPHVLRGARRLLRWEPKGSVLVELPNSETIRFGRASSAGEPLLKLRNYGVLGKALRRGAIGFADAYIDGDIDCSDLVALFRFFMRNRKDFDDTGRNLFKVRFTDRIAHLMRRNSRRGARRNISEHYDLGNDFYRPWLDPEMVYSSGLFVRGAKTLEEAQHAKLNLIFEMLELSGGERILELGCGWGAFARAAARAYGARVTGITLSDEQLAHARGHAARENLAPLCDFRLQDYRDVDGQFDHIASIEMIEAVGEEHWPRYFQILNDKLKPGGTAVIQSITIDESRFQSYRRKADFIQRYIFPGGMLPTATTMVHHAGQAGLRLDRVERFGPCYARTLREWRRRFEAAWPGIAELGFDERFRRKWHYYLTYCEAGFLDGMVDVGVYRFRKDAIAGAL